MPPNKECNTSKKEVDHSTRQETAKKEKDIRKYDIRFCFMSHKRPKGSSNNYMPSSTEADETIS
jgi:hypothetical protein